MKQPTLFVPHGGGPWPFVDLSGFISADAVERLRRYFVELPKTLPSPPRALLVVSAHWEMPIPTVMSAPAPPIFYDYYGFPPESYRIEWPAPGDPALAARVIGLLEGAGFRAGSDPERGFDHGTFIPFKVSWPNADVPTVQLSLVADLDPPRHLAIGRALAPLREEGVLILGSGMSFHNLRALRTQRALAASEAFDDWLVATATQPAALRDEGLVRWASAPSARAAHPREEHLLPLMVVAGAAGEDRGRPTFHEEWMGARICALEFGAG